MVFTDEKIYQQSQKVWNDNIKLFPDTRLKYPDENIVRLLSGKWVNIPEPPASLLDHGFGTANTLEYAISLGYKCGGCEISEQFIKDARNRVGNIDLRLVKGLEIPFEDDLFDIVISWNVIHYLGKVNAVKTVLGELRRVMKPGGVLLLSTLHPNNSLFERTMFVEVGSYVVEKESPYDNRIGLLLYCARNWWELKELFSDFNRVTMGYAEADLFNPQKKSAWYLVYAVK